MASTAAVEVRSLGDEELLSQLREAKEELFNLRFQVATGQLDNNRRLQIVRRSIARIYTVMRERELGITYATAVAESAPVEEPKASTTKAAKASTTKASTTKAAKAKATTEKAETADVQPPEADAPAETTEVDA